MRKHWKYTPSDPAIVTHLQEVLKINPIFCQLLAQRGIHSFETAKYFFRPQLRHLHDPFLMKSMAKAVERLGKAIRNKERILLYGDYDVDGTTSVAMLYAFLAKRHQKLDYYIPDRYKEGYGISLAGIDYAKQNQVNLLIAMDCGIRAVDKVATANALGIDCIICDHHNPEGTLPPAIAVLDPLRPDCDYPFKHLSGCGVTLKLIQAYCQQQGLSDDEWIDLLDFVVISIAADIVPMMGENRVLAHFGLKQLNCTQRPGLQALIHESRRSAPLSINDIVFGIGPMLNAAGRLADAKLAVRLLLSDSKFIAHDNASFLGQKNRLRKEYDQMMAEEAKSLFKQMPNWQSQKCAVLFQAHWHKGIVGIAASRIIDAFHVPTIILTESNGKLVGSARSIKGFNIYEGLKACSSYLENYGGHDYAAGLTLLPENLKAFAAAFEAYVDTHLNHTDLIPQIALAAKIDLKDITPKFMRILNQFAPFGPHNRNPIFCTTQVTDNGYSKLLKGNHVKLSIQQGDASIKGIAFGRGEDFTKIQKQEAFDVCYKLEENRWKGKSDLEINVKDLRFD